MKSLRQQYRQFLTDNFNKLAIRQPLFYNWGFGLRFNLQVGRTGTDDYFAEVIRRASTLFEAAFSGSNQVFFVLMDYKYRRRKIKISSYALKQIKYLDKSEVSFLKVKRLYEPDNKFDIRNIALVKATVDRINYKNIFSAIGHIDFPPRQPRLDNNGIFSRKEIYFINIDKKLIFNMYDDRGLDIIAVNKEILRPIYAKYNDWLLDYDRENIDKQFV